MAPPIHLIVLAGGLSTRARRADASAPKQFRRIGGRMLMMFSVQELARAPGVVSLTLAVPEPWLPQARDECEAAGLPCPCRLAPGGESRTASTWNAIAALERAGAPAADDLAAVHDAARPFASRGLLARVAAAAAAQGGAVPAVPVTDTIIQLDRRSRSAGTSGDGLALYLDRGALRALQTPQVFRWGPFAAAHRWCREHDAGFTDDSGLLAARGLPPAVVMGEPENWKVTTEADLERAAALLRARAPED